MDSNHPTEHKMSAIRHLIDRNNTYPTNTENKQKEQQIRIQILQNNHYNHTLKKLKHKSTTGKKTQKKVGKIHVHRERN